MALGYSRLTPLLALAEHVTAGATNTILSLSYPPIVSVCKTAVLGNLGRTITTGRIRIITTNSEILSSPAHDVGPESPGEAVAEIKVIKDTFWLRLALQGDMGFAEAYMMGECEVNDLTLFFKVRIPSLIPHRSTQAEERRLGLHPISLQYRYSRLIHPPLQDLLPSHHPDQLPLRQHPE